MVKAPFRIPVQVVLSNPLTNKLLSLPKLLSLSKLLSRQSCSALPMLPSLTRNTQQKLKRPYQDLLCSSLLESIHYSGYWIC